MDTQILIFVVAFFSSAFGFALGTHIATRQVTTLTRKLDEAIAAFPFPPEDAAVAKQLADGLNAVLGLTQLIRSRDDCPPDIKDALRVGHRIVEAHRALAIYETHVKPPPYAHTEYVP